MGGADKSEICRSVGQAGKRETLGRVDAAALRQNCFFSRKPQFYSFTFSEGARPIG